MLRSKVNFTETVSRSIKVVQKSHFFQHLNTNVFSLCGGHSTVQSRVPSSPPPSPTHTHIFIMNTCSQRPIRVSLTGNRNCRCIDTATSQTGRHFWPKDQRAAGAQFRKIHAVHTLNAYQSIPSLSLSPSPSQRAVRGCSCLPSQTAPFCRHPGMPARWRCWSCPWQSLRSCGRAAPQGCLAPWASCSSKVDRGWREMHVLDRL